MFNEFVIMGLICSGTVLGGRLCNKAEDNGDERLSQLIGVSVNIALSIALYFMVSKLYYLFMSIQNL